MMKLRLTGKFPASRACAEPVSGRSSDSTTVQVGGVVQRVFLVPTESPGGPPIQGPGLQGCPESPQGKPGAEAARDSADPGAEL